jgi:hypothetical protein
MKMRWPVPTAIGCLAWLLAFAPLAVFAEQYLQDGEYRIYYNIFPSTLIPSSMTSRYHIERAENRYITNISIHKGDKAIPALLEGMATNLIGQKIPLEFEEITEPDAVYYLANSIVGSNDTWRVTISITVADRPLPLILEFEQRYEQ